jgi:tetratricopeptide (TPR) repeat protein
MSLANTSLLDALEMILTKDASGVLTATRVDSAQRKLHIIDGNVVFASSLAPEGRLLDRLRAGGRLTEAQYSRALDSLQKTGRKAGQVLISLRLLTEEEVVAVLEEQIYGNLRVLLEDPTIPVRFLPIPDLSVEQPHPDLPVPEALFQAFAGMAPGTLERHYPLEPEQCFRTAVTPWSFVHRFPFDAEAATVLSLVEAGRTAADIARLAGLEATGVAQRLFLLMYLGLIEPSTAPVAPPDQVVEQTESAGADQHAEAEPLSAYAQQLREELLGLDRRLEQMDYFQILRINENHPVQAIKESYRALSKRLHPDMVRGSGLAREAVEIAERVYAKLSVAYDTLTDSEKRRAYLRARQTPATARHTSPTDADTIFGNARKAIAARQFDRAAQLLTNLIERFPERSEYHYYLATAFTGLRGRKREAEQELKRAIELEPTNPNYYVGLGNLYRDGHIWDKAVAMYRAALRWDPKNRHALKAINDIEAEAKAAELGKVGGLFTRFRK